LPAEGWNSKYWAGLAAFENNRISVPFASVPGFTEMAPKSRDRLPPKEAVLLPAPKAYKTTSLVFSSVSLRKV
jgi:hypothetical protein